MVDSSTSSVAARYARWGMYTTELKRTVATGNRPRWFSHSIDRTRKQACPIRVSDFPSGAFLLSPVWLVRIRLLSVQSCSCDDSCRGRGRRVELNLSRAGLRRLGMTGSMNTATWGLLDFLASQLVNVRRTMLLDVVRGMTVNGSPPCSSAG